MPIGIKRSYVLGADQVFASDALATIPSFTVPVLNGQTITGRLLLLATVGATGGLRAQLTSPGSANYAVKYQLSTGATAVANSSILAQAAFTNALASAGTWFLDVAFAITFNAAGNYPIPYGRYQITVTGRGGTGTAAIPGNANYNPVVPGNAYYNPYTPGNSGVNPSTPGNSGTNPGTYQPGNYNFVYDDTYPGTYTPGNPFTNPSTPGNPFSNPGSGGNFAGNNPPSGGNYANTNPGSGGNVSGYNPGSGGNYANTNPSSGGNYANTNPTTPAVPGNASTALGVTLPGSNSGGSPAPVTPATLVSYYSYPDNATYPVSVPSGGYVTITSS